MRVHHQTIEKVTEDTEHLRFNTAISAMMVAVNHFTKRGGFPSLEMRSQFAQLLAPYAPHLAEEIWAVSGNSEVLSFAPWPKADKRYTQVDEVSVAVQVLGKTRGTVQVVKGADQATVEAAVQAETGFTKLFVGKQVQRVIFVPNKIINFVVKDVSHE